MKKIKAKLVELKNLQERAEALRQQLGFSSPGEVTFLAACDGCDGDNVIVEADGLGGATVSVVEGNYPVDYLTKLEKSFPSEREAERAAEKIAFKRAAADKVLGTR
jgi:hypothetical protein